MNNHHPRGGRVALPAAVLLSTLARRHGSGAQGGTQELVGPIALVATDAAHDPPPPEPVVARLADRLDKIPADERGDPAEFARAREFLLAHARVALGKGKARGPAADFTADDLFSMEAVIKADGTRPSLMLRGGAVPEDHPLLGTWRDDVIGVAREAIMTAAAATGRLEPVRGSASNYFGTGFVVDQGRGIVLTNRHVLEAMWRGLREFAERRPGGWLRFLDGAYINFLGEIGAARRRRFKVLEGRFVGDDGEGLARLDAALLRVRPLTAAETTMPVDQPAPESLPAAIALADTDDGPLGQLTSFCVVGFPGAIPPPGERQTGGTTVDWAWVENVLMGGRQGVKRVAPGKVHRTLGTLDEDRRGWCFGHDATTLGGNSGSPTLAWKDGNAAFGLHFAGLTIETNYAHSMSRVRAELDAALAAF